MNLLRGWRKSLTKGADAEPIPNQESMKEALNETLESMAYLEKVSFPSRLPRCTTADLSISLQNLPVRSCALPRSHDQSDLSLLSFRLRSNVRLTRGRCRTKSLAFRRDLPSPLAIRPGLFIPQTLAIPFLSSTYACTPRDLYTSRAASRNGRRCRERSKTGFKPVSLRSAFGRREAAPMPLLLGKSVSPTYLGCASI